MASMVNPTSCQVPPEWVERTLLVPVGWDRRARSLHQVLAGSDPTDGCPFVQAAHVSPGSNTPVTRIVIHGTVSRTYVGAALDVARYFASESSGGSAHYIVDPATVVQSVKESVIAWHAPPNPHTIGVEICDLVDWAQAQRYDGKRFPTEAAWAARWDRPEFDAMLRLAARVVRALADRHRVPLALIGPGDLLAGRHGQCSHLSVSQAWRQTDHHDPGPTFPWARFMSYVTGGAPAPSQPVQEDDMGYLIRAATGAVVFIGAQGPRLVKTPSDLGVLEQLGYTYGPRGAAPALFKAMDDGPFALVIEQNGGLVE